MARFRVSQSQSATRVVQKIPQEIVDLIFTFLSAPDQVCFSLSCKHLFARFHSYLEAQKIRLPQLLPHERRQVLCPNTRKRPRIQLLLQLENNRWKYCSECWSLHPHSTWRALRSIWRLHQKPLCSDCHLLRGQICYMPYAGEVDICPCLTITFRDKLHLMETCEYARQRAHYGNQRYYNNVLYHPSFGKLHKRLWHDCTFTDHLFAKVNVKTAFWIDEKTTCLHVCNLYKFEILQGNTSRAFPSSLKAPLMCPHERPGSWLGKFFEEAGSNFLGWDENHPSGGSFRYDWGGWGRIIAEKGPQSFELSITRNLGNGEWPNKIWNYHRRK